MKMAAQTQAPAMPFPEAFCRNELLKSWWGPVQDPQVLDVDTVVVDVVDEIELDKSLSMVVSLLLMMAELNVVKSTILSG